MGEPQACSISSLPRNLTFHRPVASQTVAQTSVATTPITALVVGRVATSGSHCVDLGIDLGVAHSVDSTAPLMVTIGHQPWPPVALGW